MPRLTKIYTRTGDDGTTALGGGQRVPKDSPRIEAYGTVDELNSVIGTVMTCGPEARAAQVLRLIQNDLFHLGSDLCILEDDKKKRRAPQIEERHVKQLEAYIDELQERLRPLENFILPGGHPCAAHLHVARCVCRRAERRVHSLGRQEAIGAFAVPYLNRLGDLLFVMARHENLTKGEPDVLWDSRA
jgi:cob(I)alamin adenosyltransferase